MPILQVRVDHDSQTHHHEIAVSHSLAPEDYELVALGLLMEHGWCMDDTEISWIVLDGDEILGMVLADGDD